MREKIKSIIAQALGIESSDIKESASLHESLGLGAPEIPELITTINHELGLNVPVEDINETKTVREFIDLVEQYKQDEL